MDAQTPQPDQITQATITELITQIAQIIDGEGGQSEVVRNATGQEIGRQVVIDAGEKGLANMCRLTILNPDLAPAGEAVRIEFEHDKQGTYETRRIYSVQTVRRVNNQLELKENFLADSIEDVREQDFRPIRSEEYARSVVLKSIQDWAKFRAWQRQGGRA